MADGQLDLFPGASAAQTLRPRAAPAQVPAQVDPATLSDEALTEAVVSAGARTATAAATEAGRRRLQAAVPALDALCRRFAGFGRDRPIPEQVAALDALATIGGGAARHAVTRAIVTGLVQGPGVAVAASAAVRLGVALPTDRVLALMTADDPAVRAAACQLVRPSRDTIARLIDLLGDDAAAVRRAAACALGRLGKTEARPALLALLQAAPTPEAVEAAASVADADIVVQLARTARTRPQLADVVRDALGEIDDERARRALIGLRPPRDG